MNVKYAGIYIRVNEPQELFTWFREQPEFVMSFRWQQRLQQQLIEKVEWGKYCDQNSAGMLHDPPISITLIHKLTQY
jgi:hypothetical protein